MTTSRRQVGICYCYKRPTDNLGAAHHHHNLHRSKSVMCAPLKAKYAEKQIRLFSGGYCFQGQQRSPSDFNYYFLCLNLIKQPSFGGGIITYFDMLDSWLQSANLDFYLPTLHSHSNGTA